MSVTQLGYGSMGLRGPKTWGVRTVDEHSADKFLNAVLDSGINFIDTSPDYGMAEQRIGDYISARRNEFYLATKCGCVYTQHDDHLEIDHVWDPDIIRGNLETSLKRMKTDYIDLLQFHGGDAETLQKAGLIDLLINFRDEGLIRHIGVSSKIPNLAGLIDLGVFETFQVPYSCLDPTHGDLITRAGKTGSGEFGAGVIVRGGIAHGGPDAEIQRPALNDIWATAALDEVLPEGMSRSELILRCTLSHPQCSTTIVGTCNHQHLAENIAATVAGPLPQELQKEIASRVAIAQSL